MRFKKCLVLFSLIIILLSISNVSASDNDTLLSEDNDQILEESDDYVISSSQEDILEDSNKGTFTDLQRIIIRAREGSTIDLDKDYVYDDGFNDRGIVIGKSLTINGNNHTLDGLSKSRILLITFGAIGENKVTLNNINFKNGYTDLYGGAIFNYGKLTVNNCVFTNNHAECCGGAINSVGNAVYSNSVFNKNTATGDGGAILTLSMKLNPEFFVDYYKNKSVDGEMNFLVPLLMEGSVEFVKEYVKNCTFTNNVASGRGGGALYAYGHIDIGSSTFKSNKAGQNGGAVFANKNLFVRTSKFYNNYAPKYGGAIYFKCHEISGKYVDGKWVSGLIKFYANSIQTSTFIMNSASKGGAIFGFKSSTSGYGARAINCVFEVNKASQGRDIYGGKSINGVFNYNKLTLSSVTVKKSVKSLELTSILKKGSKPLSGKTITFKFNGKTYTAKTDSKGIAKVIIKSSILKNLIIGKKITYQVIYGKLSAKRTATVKR